MLGTPDSVGSGELEYSVIKIMKVIDIEVDDRNMDVCRRIAKLKGKSKKAIARFYNRKIREKTFYSNKKLASVNTAAFGLGNSTKLFISENLKSNNNKICLSM